MKNRAAKLLVAERDRCEKRLSQIDDERRMLNDEEVILGNKMEQLNKTISLFAEEAKLQARRKGGRTALTSKKAAVFKPKDALDIPLEIFAALQSPSWCAVVCQDIRAILFIQKRPLTTEEITAIMQSKHEYAKRNTFNKTLQVILKAARQSKGHWLVFKKQGQKFHYSHR